MSINKFKFDKKNLFKKSNSLSHFVKTSQDVGVTQNIPGAIKPIREKMLMDDKNPLAGYAENLVESMGIPGSGFLKIDQDVLKTLPGVPAEFKNDTLDEMAQKVNLKIPRPEETGLPIDKYRTVFLPDFLQKSDVKKFFDDASLTYSLLFEYIHRDLVDQIGQSKLIDPKDLESIKKGIKIYFDMTKNQFMNRINPSL